MMEHGRREGAHFTAETREFQPALPDASLYYLNFHPSSLKSTLAYPRHVRDALHLFDTHSGDCELLLEAKPLALDMVGT